METSNVGCPVRGRPVSTNVTRECPAPCAPRAGRSGQTGRPAGAVSGSGNQPGTLFVACCTGFRGGGSRRAGFTFTSCLRSELTRPHPTCHTTRAPAQPVAGCTVIATKAGSEGNGAPNQSPTRCRHFTLLTLYVTQSRGSQAMSAGGRCDERRRALRSCLVSTSSAPADDNYQPPAAAPNQSPPAAAFFASFSWRALASLFCVPGKDTRQARPGAYVNNAGEGEWGDGRMDGWRVGRERGA